MRRVEVRCCCVPSKLLGSLPVMDRDLVLGRRIEFVVLQRFGEPRLPRVSLEIATWESGVGRVELAGGLAIKSNDVPIEVLRRIPGFIEAGTPGLPTEATS